jgi:hypothetical protein
MMPPKTNLTSAARCPLCDGNNQCRIATGCLYKGPCWCELIIVPLGVLRCLAAEHGELVCLCCRCLATIAAVSCQLDEPDSRLFVFSAARLAHVSLT